MRKILAIILAVAMLATFVPVASATEVSGEEKITVFCDLEQLMIELGMHTNYNVSLSALNYAATGDIFRYIRSSLTPATQSYNEVANDIAVTKVIGYPGATPSYDNRGFLTLYKQAASGSSTGATWVSFEVNIPKDGNYTFKLNHKKGRSNYAGVLKVYMTDAETYRLGGSFGTLLTGSGLSTLDSTVTRDADSIANTSWADNQIIFENQKMNAGKYVVTYAVETGATLARAAIGSFTFEGTPVVEEPVVVPKVINYNVAKIMKENGIYYAKGQDAAAEVEKITYKMTNGLFEVQDARGSISIGGSGATIHNFIKIAQNATVEVKVNIPEDGKYFLDATHQVAKKDGVPVIVFIDGEFVGSYNCKDSEGTAPDSFASGDTSVWKKNVLVTQDGVDLTAGEHIVSFAVQAQGYGMISSFNLTNNELEKDSISLVYVDKTTLEIGEATNISGAVVSSFEGVVKAQSDAATAYTSSNENVIKVTGTKVEAIGTGVAEIKATVGGVEAKRTITVLNEKLSGNASLGVYSDVAGYVTAEIDGVVNNDMVKYVPIGSTVSLTAKTDDPAYIFRGWKRGSKDKGVWYSDEETISFPMVTNAFFTALYEPVADEDVVNVEFYNYNGQYFETAENVGTKTFGEIMPETMPILTGYSNPFWTLDGTNSVSPEATFKKLTRIVAKYENVESYEITIGEGISGHKSGRYEYDTELVLAAKTEGTWYVDKKPVAYGDKYLHYVWNDAEITFDEAENNVPIISINNETKSNGARMISYDANGANIAEVGILFGAKLEITRFGSKATSKNRGNSQQHFTAIPNSGSGENARGYLIYRDGEEFRVIYAD